LKAPGKGISNRHRAALAPPTGLTTIYRSRDCRVRRRRLLMEAKKVDHPTEPVNGVYDGAHTGRGRRTAFILGEALSR